MFVLVQIPSPVLRGAHQHSYRRERGPNQQQGWLVRSMRSGPRTFRRISMQGFQKVGARFRSLADCIRQLESRSVRMRFHGRDKC